MNKNFSISIRNHWIVSPAKDSIFILLPPFLTLAVVLLFKDFFFRQSEVNLISWVLLVLFVDVAHVYSTLFRTYFNKGAFEKNRSLFLYVPFFTWIIAVLLYYAGPLYFWRCIAYLAVFHFIRQQYGFMKLYTRGDQYPSWSGKIDLITIYSVTLYPIIFWHLSGPKNFEWFVKDDFYFLNLSFLNPFLTMLYLIILLTYFVKEVLILKRYHQLNLAKNLIIIGTAMSWYFGIVYFDSDIIFTALNILSHGIPYMALVWLYEAKKTKDISGKISILFRRYGWLLFLLIIFIFAWIEEGLWDAMVWKEHKSIFSFFSFMPFVQEPLWLSIIIPTLSLPQLTHYVLDGFIWRISKKEF